MVATKGRWHYSPNTKMPEECNANVRPCPFPDQPHGATALDVIDAVEAKGEVVYSDNLDEAIFNGYHVDSDREYNELVDRNASDEEVTAWAIEKVNALTDFANKEYQEALNLSYSPDEDTYDWSASTLKDDSPAIFTDIAFEQLHNWGYASNPDFYDLPGPLRTFSHEEGPEPPYNNCYFTGEQMVVKMPESGEYHKFAPKVPLQDPRSFGEARRKAWKIEEDEALTGSLNPTVTKLNAWQEELIDKSDSIDRDGLRAQMEDEVKALRSVLQREVDESVTMGLDNSSWADHMNEKLTAPASNSGIKVGLDDKNNVSIRMFLTENVDEMAKAGKDKSHHKYIEVTA